MASTLQPGELLALDALVTLTAQGIASRVLARTAAGNIAPSALDAVKSCREHTAPFDALVLTLSGSLVLMIAGVTCRRYRSRSCRCRQTCRCCSGEEPSRCC